MSQNDGWYRGARWPASSQTRLAYLCVRRGDQQLEAVSRKLSALQKGKIMQTNQSQTGPAASTMAPTVDSLEGALAEVARAAEVDQAAIEKLAHLKDWQVSYL